MLELSDLWRSTSPDAVNISGDFSPREFAAALHHLKPGKAPSLNSICPDHLIHANPDLKSWLRGLLSSCLRRLKIPKVLGRALVVAILKPSKPVKDPQIYRLIFLICVPYKILEPLICNRVEPIVDPLLPKKQAGFWTRKSTVDQVVLLTQNIEDSFEAQKERRCRICQSDSCVWHCLAPYPHLQAAETSAGQAHSLDDHGTCSE